MTAPDLPVEAPQAGAATIDHQFGSASLTEAHRRCRNRVPDRGRRTPSRITCWATTPLSTPPRRCRTPSRRRSFFMYRFDLAGPFCWSSRPAPAAQLSVLRERRPCTSSIRPVTSECLVAGMR